MDLVSTLKSIALAPYAARTLCEQRDPANHEFRAGIKLLREAEADAIRAGHEMQAQRIRAAVNLLTQAWRGR